MQIYFCLSLFHFNQSFFIYLSGKVFVVTVVIVTLCNFFRLFRSLKKRFWKTKKKKKMNWQIKIISFFKECKDGKKKCGAYFNSNALETKKKKKKDKEGNWFFQLTFWSFCLFFFFFGWKLTGRKKKSKVKVYGAFVDKNWATAAVSVSVCCMCTQSITGRRLLVDEA